MLVLDHIEVLYLNVVLALSQVSMRVDEGRIAVLLGNNGSGKSTTLKSISGILRTENGKLNRGKVELNGKRIDHLNPEEVAQRGICHILQGHPVFEDLSTEENLLMGAHLQKNIKNIQKNLTTVYGYFPKLKTLRQSKSGYLSGGEQQMLCIGRAMMAQPKIMLLDEPSLGLAPRVVTEIFEVIKNINQEQKTTFIVAEQNAYAVLPIADYGYVLQTGKVVLEGPAEVIRNHQDVKKSYLGSRISTQENYYSSLSEKWRK